MENMMTRAQYLEASTGKNYPGKGPLRAHRKYFAQFVTDEVRDLVDRAIKARRWEHRLNDADLHLNSIPLKFWDDLVGKLPRTVAEGLKNAGDWLSLGTGVCVLKEAARQLRESDTP